ncbi:MAG TPA: ELM1/GtrOC1 family putative glycosyltransferase [Candidatus Omnitrophota bacterium]|nr:mitochondrial fission ELM1 family protein [Candidatus Omnitrophota bacterium]HQO57349.1 ELM1/GtrOC1 family putative glycosyltransferase [Candidatus Omnitrophota bacterium]
MLDYVLYVVVKAFGGLVRRLPLGAALMLGRFLGRVAYFFDSRHRIQVLLNLKTAFSSTKTPEEIQATAQAVFVNFGQNMIELLRMPNMTPGAFKDYVTIEGREHVEEALKGGKGVILLAMHSGSWELANLASTTLGGVYKVMVNPQPRFPRLDTLLNSYRSCGGSVVLERGSGTREMVKSLLRNEIVAMVVDHGGKSGQRVPFFNREASLSVGAVRLALKFGTPICFAIIRRDGGAHHHLTIHKPMDLFCSGNGEKDVRDNLTRIAGIMEKYVRENPAEYMWFYKIWKYATVSEAVLLNDGRTGHLRQSQAVLRTLEAHLKREGRDCRMRTVEVVYRNALAARALVFLGCVSGGLLRLFRLPLLKWCLTPESFRSLFSVKPDFVISCGSASAYVNFLLSAEQYAKNVSILKPGVLNVRRFSLVILPEHDRRWDNNSYDDSNVIFTKGALNLINAEYLQENAERLRERFSQLKIGDNFKIGVLLGGDTKECVLSVKKVKIMVHQLIEASEEMNADILLTTSRRTSEKVENFIPRHLKHFPRCRLLILANRHNVPEAVGGILGLSDMVIVSGDSVSMISEAACSGKPTIVFPIQNRFRLRGKESKHNRFIDVLTEQGYILATDVRHIKQAVYNLVKNKIRLHPLDDSAVVEVGLKRIL